MGRKVVKTKLQGMQRDWVLHFLADPKRNATAAARAAGYKRPEQSGWENRHNPKIQQYISEYFLDRHMTAEEAVARISEVAAALPYGSYLRDVGDGNFAVDLELLIEDGLAHLVKSVSWVRTGAETAVQVVEFHDSYRATVDMARVHGLFGAKGTQDDPIHVDPIKFIEVLSPAGEGG